MTSLDTWTSSKLGFHIVGKQAYKDGVVTVGEFLKQWAGKLLPAAGKVVSSGAALVFKLATIGLFTFYLTADFPRLQRAFLSWFKPGQQERLGWTVDQSIKQVGGYLYSRLLLTVINGLGFVAVMVAVGVPTGLAIPLAVFGGFVSEFIPSVGTYIGGAVPAVLTLALAGPGPGAHRRRLHRRLPADRELLAEPEDQREDDGAQRRPGVRSGHRRRRPVRPHRGLHGAARGRAHRGGAAATTATRTRSSTSPSTPTRRSRLRRQKPRRTEQAGRPRRSSRIVAGSGREEGSVPRKVDWDERRAAVAEAVWRTIQRHGIAHTSIRNIAEESGWTRGVLQLYFRDKDELMLFAFELACDHALEVNGRVVGDATGLEIVRRLLMAYARPDEEQRLVTLVLTSFIARTRTHPELAEVFRRRWNEWLGVTEEIFAGLAAGGALREGLDPALTAVEYFALASGLAQLDIIGGDLCDVRPCERLVDDYLRKIGSPAELKRLGLEPLEPAAL